MRKWLSGRVAARSAVLVALVMIINVIYIPAHIALEHDHDEVEVTVVALGDHHHDGDHDDGRRGPLHDADDHKVKATLVPTVAVIPQSCGDIVLMVLSFAQPLIPIADPQWCPDCMDSERLPPGPSRAPPV